MFAGDGAGQSAAEDLDGVLTGREEGLALSGACGHDEKDDDDDDGNCGAGLEEVIDDG